MRRVTLILGLIILIQTAFAVEKSLDGPTPQLNKQSNTNAWWTDRMSGLVGGIAGLVVGLTGAAIGTLAGTGIARKVCLSLLGAMLVFGIASLAVGLAALAFSQPYAVYYPLLLLGLLCSVLPAGLFRSIKQQYEQRELRKMNAMDIK
jgi:ABC-type dipeptide/oligopeptide/nickel transport system permease subunit